MTIQNLHLLPIYLLETNFVICEHNFIKNQLRDANRILLETNFITLRTLLYRISYSFAEISITISKFVIVFLLDKFLKSIWILLGEGWEG